MEATYRKPLADAMRLAGCSGKGREEVLPPTSLLGVSLDYYSQGLPCREEVLPPTSLLELYQNPIKLDSQVAMKCYRRLHC